MRRCAMTKRKKPRRRTNKDIPAKGRLRDFADTLWSRAIKLDWAGKCAICRKFGDCEAHHIIPREYEATRYDLQNGILLCATHHKFDPELSPHLNAFGWMHWLALWAPGRHDWAEDVIENGFHKSFKGTKNAWHYIDIIQKLRHHLSEQDVNEIAVRDGYVKFLAWLDTQSETCDGYSNADFSGGR